MICKKCDNLIFCGKDWADNIINCKALGLKSDVGLKIKHCNCFIKKRKNKLKHYLIYRNKELLGCTGDRSTKESVLRIHHSATFKRVKGICPNCKKKYV